MDGATRDAIAAAIRSRDATLVVVGDAVHREAAAVEALSSDPHVVEVCPPEEACGPWAGLAALLAACRDRSPEVAPPAALEAVATGQGVGDHLGLAADLSGHLQRIAERRPLALVVRDAHRFDLSSAAVLERTLADTPSGVSAVVTQDPSGRGIAGVAAHVVRGIEEVSHPTVPATDPAEVEAARRRSSDAGRLRAVLDAAAEAEVAGDWVAAARWWLEGGRPRRCELALAAAGPDPAAAAIEARLALRTAGDQRRRAITDQALARLEGVDQVAAARLRTLDAAVRIVEGDAEGAAEALDAAVTALDASGRAPDGRAGRELHEVVTAMLALAAGGPAADVVRSVERPLARLGAGGIDADAVQVLASAAVPLGRHEHFDEARSLLDRVIGVLDARRHFVLLPHPLAASAWLARRRGRLELARTHGARAVDLARACGWAADERRAAAEVSAVEASQGGDGTGSPVGALSVDDLRIALALADGAETEDVAIQLRLTPRHVAEVRARVLGLLGIDDAEHLAGLLQLERSSPSGSAALVRILGPLVVQRGEQQLVPPTGRPAALLAVVATEGGAVPVDRVLDALWPDADADRARSRLRNVLARLRTAVGPVVERAGEQLVLASGVEVDARRFDRLVDEALRAGPDDLLDRSEEALAAWAGEPLPSWPYEDWALRARTRLVQRCVTLHVRRAEVLVDVGAVGAALDELEQAVTLHPDAGDVWARAVELADADGRVGRARALRRRAADHDIVLG